MLTYSGTVCEALSSADALRTGGHNKGMPELLKAVLSTTAILIIPCQSGIISMHTNWNSDFPESAEDWAPYQSMLEELQARAQKDARKERAAAPAKKQKAPKDKDKHRR